MILSLNASLKKQNFLSKEINSKVLHRLKTRSIKPTGWCFIFNAIYKIEVGLKLNKKSWLFIYDSNWFKNIFQTVQEGKIPWIILGFDLSNFMIGATDHLCSWLFLHSQQTFFPRNLPTQREKVLNQDILLSVLPARYDDDDIAMVHNYY